MLFYLMTAFDCEFNRSMQHLILLYKNNVLHRPVELTTQSGRYMPKLCHETAPRLNKLL